MAKALEGINKLKEEEEAKKKEAEEKLRKSEEARKIEEQKKAEELTRAKQKAEAEEKAKKEAEQKKKIVEANAKKAKEEAERAKRQAEETDKARKDEEKKKKAKEEKVKKATEEAERAKRQAEEADKARKDEEKKKKAMEEKVKKATEEAERAKRQAEETEKAKKETEQKKKLEAEKLKEQVAAAEKAKKDEETRKKAESEKAKKAAEEVENIRKKAEAAEKAKVAEEAKKKEQADLAKKAKEESEKAKKMAKEAEAKAAAAEKKSKQAKEEAEKAKKDKDTEEARKAAEAMKKKSEEAAQKKVREEAQAKKLNDEPLDSAAREKIAENRNKDQKQAKDSKRDRLRMDEDRIKAAQRAGKVAKEQEEMKKADPSHLSLEDVPSDYPKIGITSPNDVPFLVQLDQAEGLIKSNTNMALSMFEDIITRSGSQSPRALHGKARCLERLSEMNKSNDQLEQAIEAFLEVIALGTNVAEPLLKMAGHRCVERLQFRGWNTKAIRILQSLIKTFPNDPGFSNDLGVQFLLVGQNKAAKEVLRTILQRAPDNAKASVHLGFILKTTSQEPQDLETAVQLMQTGIASGEEGTQDARFWYHLGEGLRRLGREEEADRMYKLAVEKKIFRSFWQRSLYNVDHLRSRPVWSKLETGQSENFKLLENNWKTIREEALSVLRDPRKGFEPEGENLKDTGDWGQFELFRQGRLIQENCALTPKTCALIQKIPAAFTNKRGQVKFSLMRPGTHVHAHTGPTNCRLRAHLGLQVPKSGQLRLRVADENLTWVEGQIFVFDDSFDHEVWHEADGDRIVLIVDIWHPDLDDRTKASLSPI
ncbi:aspartyl/asparaginyl beta-hydroxylase-like [Tigriopus californicus]|uniref:aspartyl/asparaginyl beta-hydroxylase-like n=1 Tax=Tigriopus californicus TaxID=6832 RepID=UPI0027DA43B8|nr:aspartyl/asparaginyl beta-hydroxylase-like [Tigriopus californicus]